MTTTLRALLLRETEEARLFQVVDREVWIPRSVTPRITKFMPDLEGRRACLIEVEDWFADKLDL